MEKLFIQIDGQMVHFKCAGEGRPLILLHASPSSSAMMLPLMEQLSRHFLVIAPDIPACGLSQPLAIDFNDMADYARFFHRFFQHLGLKKIAIYGTATGAQIAIRYALDYPEWVSHLYLDNTADFSETQSDRILQTYFPKLHPQYDGSHLLKMWTLVRDLFVFFPWSWSTPEHRLQQSFPPATILHQVALDFLQAGGNYDRAYRAAFLHEKAENVQALQVPTVLFNWAGSILKPYLAQLLNADLPKNITVLPIPAGRVERFEEMTDEILKTYQQGEPQTIKEMLQADRGMAFYQSSAGIDLHYHYDWKGEEMPILLLHDRRSSAEVVFAEMQNWAGKHPMLAVNLPGHGYSDWLENGEEPELVADLIEELMRTLNWTNYSIIARGFGQKIKTVLIDKYGQKDFGFIPLSSAPLPKLEPDEYGTHLIKAWYYLRDIELFFDPNQKTKDQIRSEAARLNAEDLQRKLKAWMQCKI